MKKRDLEKEGLVGVELKYCEHCGVLWVRERGAGVVYCGECREKVDDLPMPKKKPRKVTLPGTRPSSVAERYGNEPGRREVDQAGFDVDDGDLEAMGGVA